MGSLEYEDLFSFFLGYVTDVYPEDIDEDDLYEVWGEYLHKAVSKTYIRRLFSSISVDDDDETVDFELKKKTDDSQDEDFVKDILAKAMVVEWLQPQVKSKLNTMQLITGKHDQTFYSQSAHISELRALLDDTKTEVRQEIRDRGFVYNSYLDGD